LTGWDRYSDERAKYYAERSHAWQQLRSRLKQERRALHDRQRERRARVLSGDYAGRGQLLNTLRAALAEEQRSENQAQRRGHAVAREQLRAQYPRFPGLEQWLRDQGREALAEQWRYRECAGRSLQQSAAIAGQLDASLYTRFAADWKVQQGARQDAVGRAWAQYARDVARLKSASKQRWATVRLVAKGPIAGKLWALNARMADQHAWRKLHERHRAALHAADRQNRPLDWRSWLLSMAAQEEQLSTTAPRLGLPMRSAVNAVTADGTTIRHRAAESGSATVVLHRVPDGIVQDEGNRLTLSEGSTQKAFEALLHLARARYGARLGVDGDEVFRERLVQAATAGGLDVTFTDPQLEARRQQLLRHSSQERMNALNPRLRSGTARAGIARDGDGPTRPRKGRSR
jgi:hypothetical protein